MLSSCSTSTTRLFLRYWTNMHRGSRSSTGHDAAHHGMMLSVVPRSRQRGGSRMAYRRQRSSQSQQAWRAQFSHQRALFTRSSLITGRIPLTHVTVTRRPYSPSCGRCYSHSLTTLLASLLTTTRNTSRGKSIVFAHRQRHHCRAQSTSATFLSYFLPGGRQPSKK